MSPSKAASKPRSAREVIDESIRENLRWDWLRWCLVTFFALVGGSAVIAGMISSNGLVSLSGAAVGILCWPALHYATGFRRENVTLRLLELALDNASSREDAKSVIMQAFLAHYGTTRGLPRVVPQTQTHPPVGGGKAP